MTESGVFFATPQSHEKVMSGSMPEAGIATTQRNICFVPKSRHPRAKQGMDDLQQIPLLLSHKPNQSLALYRVSRSQ